jgi:acyl-CoA reductase-like NAD-dependent aldehyde dehydrogenase
MAEATALTVAAPNLFQTVNPASGYGREVSEFGIREFCNIKTVLIEEL